METSALSAPPETAAAPKSHFWDGEGFGFTDVLAALNPLQHLPLVGPIYRELTGDSIGNVARVVGDALFGGPIGFVSGLLNVAVVEETGKDGGAHVIDYLKAPHETSLAAQQAQVPQQLAKEDQNPIRYTAYAAPAALPVTLTAAAATGPAEQPAQPGPAAAVASAAPVTAAAQPPKPADPAPGATPAAAGGMALPQPAARAMPIDMSRAGLTPITGANQTVPLTLSGGALAQRPTPQPTPTQLLDRMRDGLEKYNRMMAAQNRSGAAAAVDRAD